MTAKTTIFAVKCVKGVSTMVARMTGRLNTAPPRLVVAGHVAESSRFSVICKCLKRFAASLADINGARLGLGRLAGTGAIASASIADEGYSAFFTYFFHSSRVSENLMNIKHFDIACRRVDEATRQPDMFIAPPAPQPTQEGFDV